MSKNDESIYFNMCSMCGHEGFCFEICISMYNEGNYQFMCWLCARRMTLQYQKKIQKLENLIKACDECSMEMSNE